MERRQITFDEVSAEARELASEPYEQPTAYLPDRFRDMGYDEFRKIRFRPDRAIWLPEQLPFQLQLFHRGYLFEQPVSISEYTETHLQEIPYVADFFNFSDLSVERLPRRNSGYAGWRLHSTLNTQLYYDEVIAFLGASYFRAVGKGQKYGLSARGILIPNDTQAPEEFPAFTQFWIRKPGSDSRTLTAMALLNGPSLTGAYSFRITPGDPTLVDVKAILYPRRDLGRIGLGSLTSMFYFGENTHPKPDDFRPEVHDSDGLSLEYNTGEVHWRPLNIGPIERASSFPGIGLHAFGLYQRDRNFQHYLDTESHYNERPSARVVLGTGFESGEVMLREIPPDKDFFDNIVAAYIPDSPFKAGKAYQFSYTLQWGTFSPSEGLAHVILTRHGRDIHDPDKEVFLVEFQLPDGIRPPELSAEITASANGRLVKDFMDVDEASRRVRIRLQVVPESGGPIHLSATLKSGAKIVSETWLYRWNPYN